MRRIATLEALESRCLLTTITVTTTADEIVDDADISLREAITAANSTAGTDTLTIGFNIAADQPGHFFYADDGVAGQVSREFRQPTTANDDAAIFNIDPDFPHSWWSIALASALPIITHPVVIDGYMQGAGTLQAAEANTNGDLFGGINATLRIEIVAVANMGAAGDGSAAKGGLSISAGGSTVRGLVINGFINGSGIELLTKTNPDGSLMGDHNRIQGNFIGTDVSGTLAHDETVDFALDGHGPSYGVHVWRGSSHNLIGTDGDGANDPAERNLISGNWYGIVLRGSGAGTEAEAAGATSGHNTIAGNFLGTDLTGMQAVPNWTGITAAFLAHDDVIGVSSTNGLGPAHSNPAAEGNLISGNRQALVFLGGSNPPSEVNGLVAGNLIGPDRTGLAALTGVAKSGAGTISFSGNARAGIGVAELANHIQIGSPNAGLSNTIAFNDGAGVWLFDFLNRGAPTGIHIQGNSIFDNTGLGIDLGGAYPSPGPNGVTDNDPLDVDDGPNRFQNFPVIVSATFRSTSAVVSGSFQSSPNATFVLDFYGNPSSSREGKHHLGAFTVETDANGQATFHRSLAFSEITGDTIQFLTTTATDMAGNTSEFSAAVETVANHAPGAEVAIDLERPNARATLTATATVSDSDLDTVTLSYVWRINEVAVQTTADTTALTDTLDLSTLTVTAGDVVSVEIVPHDGTTDGSLAQESVTVVEVEPAAWDGEGDGRSWDDARNWSGDQLPGANSAVTIDFGANNFTVTLSGHADIWSLNSLVPITVSPRGELKVAEASSLAGLSVLGDGSGLGLFGGTGDVTVTGNTVFRNSQIEGRGTMTLLGNLEFGNTNLFRRTLITHGLTIWDGRLIDEDFGGQWINLGTIRREGDDNPETSGAPLPIRNRGVIEIRAGLLPLGDHFEQSEGRLTLNGGDVSGKLDIQGGVLDGSGTVFGEVTMAGQLSPGFSPGQITVEGNYVQESAGEFKVELFDNGSLIEHDQLTVIGEVFLGGTLTVMPLNSLASLGVNAQFTIIDNDGDDPIDGTFLGLSQGSRILVGSNLFAISYHGGDGNDVVLTRVFNDLSFSANGNTVLTATVLPNGHLQVKLGNVVQPDVDPATVRSLLFNGGSGNDTINLTGLSSNIYPNLTSIVLRGGAGNDTITGSSFDEVISGNAGNDVLKGGGGTNTLTESGDVNFVLTNSSLTGIGNDSLTGFQIANLTGGLSARMFTVSGWTGAGTIVGGGGGDTIVAKKNANFTLSNTALQTSDGMNVSLSGVARASLTGGSGNNSFTVVEWTGTATLSGATGSDTIRVTRDASMTIGTNSLTSVGFGTLTLAALEVANLTGGAGNNTFTVSGWTSTGSITGGGGNDTVVASRNSNFTLSDSRLAIANGGTMSLNDVRSANLIGGAGNNVFTVGDWTGLGSLTGGGGTDTVAATRNADFVLGRTQLTISTGTSLKLSGIGVANLTGGADNNAFNVSDWRGTGMMSGAGGSSDQIVAERDEDMTLTNSALTADGFGTLTLSRIETARLTGGSSDNVIRASAFSLGSVTLQGGAGDDVLVGGSQTDLLSGDTGRDLLIGGAGADTLTGGDGDDILIGGSSTHSSNLIALAEIMAEWTSANDVATRVQNLISGDGANGTVALGSSTIQNDSNAVDQLAGDSASDWFFKLASDILIDFDSDLGDILATL